jgi:bifunctional DNase/RNase
MSDERPEDQSEEQEQPGNLEDPPPFFPYDDLDAFGRKPESYGDPVLVTVEGVYIAQDGKEVHRFVLLTDGLRKLPIQIGAPETTAITIPLEGHKTDRPMTHDLLVSMVERLEGLFDRVVIDDLWGSTYYAKIYIKHEEEEFEVDSRPSDAIALAVRVNVPVYVADGILQQAADGWSRP